MKACRKCEGPIYQPQLPPETAEACLWCSDEPPGAQEMHDWLHAHIQPLGRMLDSVGIVRLESATVGQIGRFTSLDTALDKLDSVLRGLSIEIEEGSPDDDVSPA